MLTYRSTLKALADPTRLVIFEKLGNTPQSVGAIASGLPVSRPATSQHLRVLLDASLARRIKVGKREHYAINPAGMAALRKYVDEFWGATVLTSFKDYAETSGE